MTKEQKFYKALQDVFIGAKIEGKGGFVNLMRIKSNYYRKIEDILKKDIEAALKSHSKFRDELFDKLYSFFSRYFTESGSIYFNSTPFHNNIYEKVYTDEKDVILFWKTQMLYYVKTDRIFRSLPVEFPSDRGVSEGRGVLKFYFDASKIETKKSNEKRSLVFELNKVREDGTIVFGVQYSEKGTKTKQDEILKAIKRKGIAISEEQLERAFRVFEKQSEVDFFINKNAKAFLQEQFKLWSYQYFWEGAKEWGADRVNQLQILKDIAFKIIDFISQFEDELVKIWNKPKFVKNSNYVITLDRIVNSPSVKGWQPKVDGVVKWNELPFNPNLKEKAKELRKAGNLSEVLLWNQVKNKQFLGLDFDRQKIIGDYIVDFYCKNLGVVIEIDGASHDGKIDYDIERDDYLKNLGLKVIHIPDVDVKNNLSDVMEFLENELTPRQTSSATPLKEGNLLDRILKHKNIKEQIKEWQELGIVDEKFKIKDVFETDLTGKHLASKYEHLPIDTKYFKDLELKILSQFENLDKSLDGWLIKSENYQALNTILPKFKEKVQTIYIDPPFNLASSDQFLYRTNYKDANWATLLENRLKLAKDVLSKKGSIFVRCDYNGNWIVRCLMDNEFGKENFRNEIIISRSMQTRKAEKRLLNKTDSLFFYFFSPENGKLEILNTEKEHIKSYNLTLKVLKKMISDEIYQNISRKLKDSFWMPFLSMPGENKTNKHREIFGIKLIPPNGRHWAFSQENLNIAIENKTARLKCNKCGLVITEQSQILSGNCKSCGSNDFEGQIYSLYNQINNNWTDIEGYEQDPDFPTRNAEILLKRVIESTSNEGEYIMDYFLGSGTTTAVAHKLGRKWLGVEMGEHFYSVVLPRMKKVLAYDKSGISKEVKNYQGGGFFKYYELEQYEEALANCKYEDGDLFSSPLITGWQSEGLTGYYSGRSPYQEYVFMKDEKMLKALEIDYEKNKVEVDLLKLYPNTPSADADTPLQKGNIIDIAETLSNLTGKWIKKITPRQTSSDTPLKEGNYEVEFEDGTKINTKDLDYKLIKPLIWWE